MAIPALLPPHHPKILLSTFTYKIFFDRKRNHKLMIKGHKNKRNLIAPAVTLKANGTATLHAAAIKRIEVNASHCRDGRSHSALMVKNN